MKFNFQTTRQYDKMDCGPTCLLMIAKHYGRFYSLQFIRDLCNITREGVSIADIGYASDKLGFHFHAVKAKFDDLQTKIIHPSILHWGQNHFVVLYKIRGNKLYIADPAKGKLILNRIEFEKKWLKNGEKGIVILLQPGSNFKNINNDYAKGKKDRLSSFLNYFSNYKQPLLYLLIIISIITFLNIFLPFIPKSIIDIGVSRKDLKFVKYILVGNIFLIACTFLSGILRDWLTLHISSRVSVEIISDYLIKLLKMPFIFFENKHPGDIIQRAQDHERIKSFIMGNALNVIFAIITFIVFSSILLFFNYSIFLIFIAGSIINFIFIYVFFNARRNLDFDYFNLMAKDQGFWIETINNIQEIKINNFEIPRKLQWDKIQTSIFKQSIKQQSLTNRQNSITILVDNFKNALITFLTAALVINSKITFGEMLSVQVIIGLLNSPLQQIVQFATNYQLAKLSFLRIKEIENLAEESSEISNKIIDSGSIIFSNVYFQYGARQPYVLQNLNFTIPKGKITAIVGDSGSGKSTILKMLLRLYEPSLGEIKIGNLNFKNLNIHDWRSLCGSVFQNGKIFNDTILNNITLTSEDIDYNQLEKVVECANIKNEIEAMPLGFKTMIGENGRGISGGQKQRILIARALYRNPDYIFFDEATNALDTINENKISSSLTKLFENKTVVVVAHRLSTIMNADQIIVLKDGKIIENGNHINLMIKKGYYYKLFKNQISLPDNSN